MTMMGLLFRLSASVPCHFDRASASGEILERGGDGVYSRPMSDYRHDEREARERRRRIVMRVVCIVIAAAMLISLVIPAIYAGL